MQLSMRGEKKIALCLAALFIFIATPSLYADIYMYRDKDGVRHFTNVPTTPEYRIYIRHNPNRKYSRYTTKKYDHLISEAANKYDVAFALVKAIIKVESDFNPSAVSRAGAKGLMQIMPMNFKDLGINNPFDPRQNILGGTRYFKRLLKRYDDQISLTLAAYNAGPTIVDRLQRVPPYPETRDYVEKVIKYYNSFSE
ncbi:MAG: lytic transglycosylase domain-containing protein [Desulfobacterales bacterium]|nr:lytic transglycosylase domain-containing protein [Desulfobacterales bacterium]